MIAKKKSVLEVYSQDPSASGLTSFKLQYFINTLDVCLPVNM